VRLGQEDEYGKQEEGRNFDQLHDEFPLLLREFPLLFREFPLLLPRMLMRAELNRHEARGATMLGVG